MARRHLLKAISSSQPSVLGASSSTTSSSLCPAGVLNCPVANLHSSHTLFFSSGEASSVADGDGRGGEEGQNSGVLKPPPAFTLAGLPSLKRKAGLVGGPDVETPATTASTSSAKKKSMPPTAAPLSAFSLEEDRIVEIKKAASAIDDPAAAAKEKARLMRAFVLSGRPSSSSALSSLAPGSNTLKSENNQNVPHNSGGVSQSHKSASPSLSLKSSTLTSKVIAANEVVFAAEDPLQEVVLQVFNLRKEWANVQKKMRGEVFSRAALLVRSVEPKEVLKAQRGFRQSAQQQQQQQRMGGGRGRGGRGGNKGHRGGGRGGGSGYSNEGYHSQLLIESEEGARSGDHPTQHLFVSDSRFDLLAQSSLLTALRHEQAQRALLMRELLLIASSLCRKAVGPAREAFEIEIGMRSTSCGSNGDDGGGSASSSFSHQENTHRRGANTASSSSGGEEGEGAAVRTASVWSRLRNQRSGEGGARALSGSDFEVRNADRQEGDDDGNGAQTDKADDRNNLLRLPTFGQIALLLRCASEMDFGPSLSSSSSSPLTALSKEAIVVPLMQCLKLRLEMRQVAIDKEEAVAAAGEEGGEDGMGGEAGNFGDNTATTSSSHASDHHASTTYELSDEGLWDILEGDGDFGSNNAANDTTKTTPNNEPLASEKEASSSVDVAKEAEEGKDNNNDIYWLGGGERILSGDSGKTSTTERQTVDGDEKQQQTEEDEQADAQNGQQQHRRRTTAAFQDGQPLQPRLVGDILASCAALGAMEEVLLLAMLHTDVAPRHHLQRSRTIPLKQAAAEKSQQPKTITVTKPLFPANTLIQIMTALGRFGYHKEMGSSSSSSSAGGASLFTALSRSLRKSLAPIHINATIIKRVRAAEHDAEKAEKAVTKLKQQIRRRRQQTSAPPTEADVKAKKEGKKDAATPPPPLSLDELEAALTAAKHRFTECLRREEAAMGAFRRAWRDREALALSIPTRAIPVLLRYLAESSVRHSELTHRLADVLIFRAEQQTEDTLRKCQRTEAVIVEEGKEGGEGEGAMKGAHEDPSMKREERVVSVPFQFSHPILEKVKVQLCSDAVEHVLTANGFETSSALATQQHMKAIMHREEVAEKQRMKRLMPTRSSHRFGDVDDEDNDDDNVHEEEGGSAAATLRDSAVGNSNPNLIPTLSAYDLQQVCRLLDLMQCPYPPLEEAFMTAVMTREHGAIVAGGAEMDERRFIRDDGATEDYVELEERRGRGNLI